MGMVPGSSQADYKQYERLHSARGPQESIIIAFFFWDMTPYILVRRNACIDLYVFTSEVKVKLSLYRSGVAQRVPGS
jgi:hypothetical protein